VKTFMPIPLRTPPLFCVTLVISRVLAVAMAVVEVVEGPFARWIPVSLVWSSARVTRQEAVILVRQRKRPPACGALTLLVHCSDFSTFCGGQRGQEPLILTFIAFKTPDPFFMPSDWHCGHSSLTNEVPGGSARLMATSL
jgi:hypothetical protein